MKLRGFIQRIHSRHAIEQQFDGDYALNVHLAPPMLSRPDPVTGNIKKRVFGPWVFTLFKYLQRFKRLRGTPLDIFGYTAERRMERKLAHDYQQQVEQLINNYAANDYDTAVELAKLPAGIRGFGHVKQASVERAEQRRLALLEKLPRNTAKSAEVARAS